MASSSKQQKASDAAAEGGTYCVTRQDSDDFASYMDASRCLQNAEHSLSQLLNDSTYSPENRDDVRALVRSMIYHEVPNMVIDAVVKHYEGEGIDVGNISVHLALSENHCARDEGLLAEVDLCGQDLVAGLSSYWLMPKKTGTNLISILLRYPPGSTLADKNGQYRVRQCRMFISYIGDDQEKYYEQNFLLNVSITDRSDVVQNPPTSWMHLDALCAIEHV